MKLGPHTISCYNPSMVHEPQIPFKAPSVLKVVGYLDPAQDPGLLTVVVADADGLEVFRGGAWAPASSGLPHAAAMIGEEPTWGAASSIWSTEVGGPPSPGL